MNGGDTVPEDLKSNRSEGKVTGFSRLQCRDGGASSCPDRSVLHLAQTPGRTPKCWTLLQPALGHALMGSLVPSVAAITATSVRKPTTNTFFCIKYPKLKDLMIFFFLCV